MAARRENGQGSLCKRKDGRWMGKLQSGTLANGKPCIRYVYAKTEAETKRKLKELQKQLQLEGNPRASALTVGQYLRNWLETVKVNQVRPSSYDKIESTLKYQIFPYLGDLQLFGLRAADIQTMVNELHRKGYSYSTISQAYHVLNGCMKTAVVRRELPFNPAEGVVLPRRMEAKDGRKYFTKEETEAIMQEALRCNSHGDSVHRLGAALVLLLETGMRTGELLALQWEDVDFTVGELFIRQSLARVRNRKIDQEKMVSHTVDKMVAPLTKSDSSKNTQNETAQEASSYILTLQPPKTRSGIRCIPLTERAKEALYQLWKATEPLHASIKKTGFVVRSKSGEPILPYSLRTVLTSVLHHCELESRGLHSLRHTFASRLFRQGVDVKTVGELLGHSDVTITYNTYIHLIQEQKRQALLLLEKQ